MHREMEKGLLCNIALGEANLAITDAKVRGVSAMAKIHYRNLEVE